MPTNNHAPETTENENLPVFEFKNDLLLLPEHVDSDLPDEFFAYGTSDDDLQF